MSIQLNTIYNFRPEIYEIPAGKDPKDLILPRILCYAIDPIRMILGYGHSVRLELNSAVVNCFMNVFDIKLNATTLAFEGVTTKINPEFAMLVLNISSICLLYLNPYAVTLVTQTKAIYVSAILLGNHVADKKYIDALKESVSIADKCIFSASLLTGAPQLIVISIVSRSVFEMYKAKQFYNKGMYIEASILPVIASLRCSALLKTYQNEITDFVQDFRANI